jgi:peptidoglycan/LPS O-acetylase OafA/YrhL
MPGTIIIANAVHATWIIIAVLLLATFCSFQIKKSRDLLPMNVTQELKAIGILAVMFGHIGYFLVDDYRFLFPLSIGAGVGVNIFLLLSGFGLTLGMLNRKLPALEFYRKRMIKVFIPFWIALIGFFLLDALVLHRTYSLAYMARSLVGFFPRADMADDINSVFWYITWILMYYILFPLTFISRRPWLSAIILFVVGQAVVLWNPPVIALVTRLYQVHTVAFPLGMIAAWALHEPKEGVNSWVSTLKSLRDNLQGVTYYSVLVIFAGIAGYTAYHSGIGESIEKEQAMSLITTLALIFLFALKRVESRFLILIGTYSYEMYLLHWPLLSRYDFLYRTLPASLATFAYLALFIGLGWIMLQATGPLGNWIGRKSQT